MSGTEVPGATTRFIATLSLDDNREAILNEANSRGEADDWAPEIKNRTSRVSPDGLSVVFMSDGHLTGYDTTPVSPGDCHENVPGTDPPVFTPKPCQEIYVYSASGAGQLSCASCDPSRARAMGGASIPGGTEFEADGASYQSRVLSDVEGRPRVFFDSRNALVSADTNGKPTSMSGRRPDVAAVTPTVAV